MASFNTNNNGDDYHRPSQVARGYAEVRTPAISRDEKSSRFEESNGTGSAVQHQHESLPYQHSHYWGQYQSQHWGELGAATNYPSYHLASDQRGQNVNNHTWNHSSQTSLVSVPSYYSPHTPTPNTANMNTQPFNKMQKSFNSHSSFACSICNVSCNHELSYQQHLNGKEHKKRVAQLETRGSISAHSSPMPPLNMNSQPTKQSHPSFHCSVCNVSCNHELAYSQHLNGKAHKKRVAQIGDQRITSAYCSPMPPPNMNIRPTKQSHPSFHCSLCNVSCNHELAYSQHLNGKAHKKRVAQSGDGVSSCCGIGERRNGSGPLLTPPADAPSTTENQTTKLLDPREKEHHTVFSAAENTDESEEEGEIDEEKEDINELYNEFTEPGSAKVQTTKDTDDEDGEVFCADVSQVESKVDSDIEDIFGAADDDNEHKNDSDIDEMFGDDENGEEDPNANDTTTSGMITSTKDQLKDATSSNHTAQNPPNHDEDEHDMFGESGDEEENDSMTHGNTIEQVSDEKSSDACAPRLKEEAEIPSYTDHQPELNDVDHMEMFGSSDEDEDNKSNKQPVPFDDVPSSQKKARPSAPMTVVEAIAAARRRASVPKAPKPDIGSQQKSSLKKNTMTILRQSSMPLTSSSSIKQRTENGVPKRSYYPPVHPDRFWSTLRGWDFIRELNDEIKKNAQVSKKNNHEAKKGKKRTHDEVGAVGADEKLPPTLPDSFDSVSQYKALWAPLLIEEARAQLLSEVISAQSSQLTAWVNRSSQFIMGVAAKVELSRSAKDFSVDSGNGSTSSMEPTVVLHLRPLARGAGMGCPVCSNDLLLFVREACIIELALHGKALSDHNDGTTSILGAGQLSQGRLGFVGHALNSRSRSVDGLLVRASQRLWNQFSSLDELFVIRIGSNITALREFNALSRVDEVPLSKYLLDGRTDSNEEHEACATPNTSSTAKFDPLSQSGLPIGFRIYVKSKFNTSQLQAITASSREYGCGGFTLIKGPPGTGKSTTLVSVLNALHLRQYQEYYAAIERIVTESEASTYYEELALLNKASQLKPRVLVCAPSNAAIDNVVVKIMSDRFVDGNGAKYSPSIVRVGAGIVNDTAKKVSLQGAVDAVIEQGTDTLKLASLVESGRNELKRLLHEIKKLRVRIQALVDACPYDICEDWEIRILEEANDAFKVLFVNHKSKTTTFDLPQKVRPMEKACNIKRLPHYVELLKSITKYVERHNTSSATLEKYIILQNYANTKREKNESSCSVSQELETHLLNTNHIVLTTLGSAGSRAIESATKFEVIVIDEAAQSSEMSTLLALQLGSSHAILVGDPQQLPATIFNQSGRSSKYDRSLFQRLEQCNHPVVMLNTQYRMHPVISEFPRHIFYEGMLLDGPNVKVPEFGGHLKTPINKKFPHFKPLTILDLDSREEREGTGLSNMHEAQLVLHLYLSLDNESDGLLAKSRVAVITPYSQQCLLLHRLFEDAFGDSYSNRVEISTVDAFQGREASIVIYSCVRAGGKGSGIGFLSDVQRMNVALTRAKYFLFIIARRRSIMINHYWRQLVGFAREKKSLIHVPIDRRKQGSKVNDLFPDLAKLVPVYKADDGCSSESEYSA